LLVVAIVVAAVCGFGAIGLILIARAVADLWTTTQVTGEILRLRPSGADDEVPRRPYVPVDDGRSPRIRAWVVRPELFGSSSSTALRRPC
jgi:hypothetical protein